MNFLDAAYAVLQQANQPLHYTAITQRALAAGILTGAERQIIILHLRKLL
jgi:hypothetical protein